MEGDVQRRIAANEDVFREVNEGIARGLWPGEEQAPVGFRCECARLGCSRLLSITLHEYEHVRAHPRRFVVAVGHELPEVETVVEALPGHVVIEKTDEAGRLAASLDPRG
jgi:hypothetical protein